MAVSPTTDPFPGRPSPQTSLNFVLLGAALFSFNLGWPIRLGQIVATLAGFNAIAAVTGYIFSARTFYGFPLSTPATGMAVHTAVSFILLVAALLSRRPSDGMMTLVTSDTHSGSMARRILQAAIVAPPLVGVMTRLGVEAGWYGVRYRGARCSFSCWPASSFKRPGEPRGARTTKSFRHEPRSKRSSAQTTTCAGRLANARSSPRSSRTRQTSSASRTPRGNLFTSIQPGGAWSGFRRTSRLKAPQSRFLLTGSARVRFRRDRQDGARTRPLGRRNRFRHWQTEEAIPVSHTHFMIREPDTGRIIGIGAVTRDISEIKRAREEIERTNRQARAGGRAQDAALRQRQPRASNAADADSRTRREASARAGRSQSRSPPGSRSRRAQRAHGPAARERSARRRPDPRRAAQAGILRG